LQATADSLYALVNEGSYPNPRMFLLDKDDFTLSDTYEIDDPDYAGIINFDVFNSDLIFLLAATGDANTYRIGWFQPSTTTFFTLGVFSTLCTSPGIESTSPSHTSSFFYKNNYFWVGGEGNVLKLGPVLCPGSAGQLWENV